MVKLRLSSGLNVALLASDNFQTTFERVFDFPLCFSRRSLHFFNSFIMISLGMDLFDFTLHIIH